MAEETTPKAHALWLRELLVKLTGTHRRVAIFYGDPRTGKLWGDVEVGTVGRSTGTTKVPLLIKTKRSYGGGAILVNNILRIEEPTKPYRILYRAPLAPATRRETMAEVYEAWGRSDILPYMDEYGNVSSKIRNAPFSKESPG